MTMRRLAMAVMALVLVVGPLAAGARADSSLRPAQPEEKRFHQEIFAALERAMPPVPAGWEVRQRSQAQALEWMPEGSEEGPMTVSYKMEMWDPERSRQAEAKIMAAAQETMARQEKQMDAEAIQNRIQELAQQMMAAVEKNDQAEIQRVQKEMSQVGQQMEAQGQAINQRLAESTTQHGQDLSAQVAVWANDFTYDFLDPVRKVEDVAGHPVWRTSGSYHQSRGWVEGTSHVFLGAWQPPAETEVTTMEALPHEAWPHTRAQTLVITVRAAPERARRLLEGMDLKALAGLVGRP